MPKNHKVSKANGPGATVCAAPRVTSQLAVLDMGLIAPHHATMEINTHTIRTITIQLRLLGSVCVSLDMGISKSTTTAVAKIVIIDSIKKQNRIPLAKLYPIIIFLSQFFPG